MTDEGKLYEAVSEANQAGRELEIAGAAFTDLRAAYIAAWEGTKPADHDARERLWQAVQIVGKVEAHLKRMVDEGKVAARQLDEIARLGEAQKRFKIF
jgi:hypothetical protein